MKPLQMSIALDDDVAGLAARLPTIDCDSAPWPLPYTPEESVRASRDWKATCGPHAIAAATGVSLDEVRDTLADYKGWMSPTQVENSLTVLGVAFRRTSHLQTKALCDGLNRLQWAGPWLNPGMPPFTAYRHTHWIAQRAGWVLCTATAPAQWIPILIWLKSVGSVRNRGSEPWHITHHYELIPTQQLSDAH
ncbi:MAG: hypothetical protein PHE83_16620 [Opitutaceae bacterium]|nr:hypothetical protein [Opitutaceae bacterium]